MDTGVDVGVTELTVGAPIQLSRKRPQKELAGAFEVVFASSRKPAQGFTRLGPSVLVVAFGAAAVVTLTKALDSIPIATAYAAFTGIGAAGTVVVGALVFHEPARLAQLLCIGLVVAGVIRLRVTGP